MAAKSAAVRTGARVGGVSIAIGGKTPGFGLPPAWAIGAVRAAVNPRTSVAAVTIRGFSLERITETASGPEQKNRMETSRPSPRPFFLEPERLQLLSPQGAPPAPERSYRRSVSTVKGVSFPYSLRSALLRRRARGSSGSPTGLGLGT